MQSTAPPRVGSPGEPAKSSSAAARTGRSAERPRGDPFITSQAQDTRRNDDTDNDSILMPSKTENPCRNRGFCDWDRSDLNREPKDYESAGTQEICRSNEQPDSELEKQVETASNGAQQKAQHFRPDAGETNPQLARLIECWPRLTDEDRQVLVDQAVQLATEQNERQQTVSHSFVEEPVQTKESFGRDAFGSRR